MVNNFEIKFKLNFLGYKNIDDLMYFIRDYEVYNLNNIVMIFDELKDDLLISNVFD